MFSVLTVAEELSARVDPTARDKEVEAKEAPDAKVNVPADTVVAPV